MAMVQPLPTALLVDDDPEMLLLWRLLLNAGGHVGPIHEARGGEEALGWLLRVRPDVVVTDLRMPRVSGFEVLAAVRTLYPEAIVVATSGADEVEAEALDAGASLFLPKYRSGTRDLTDAVDDLIRQRRMASASLGATRPPRR